jgi:FkbH-like protein
MTLIEALERLKAPVGDDWPTARVVLACGFTPVHLETFAKAALRGLWPQRRLDLRVGLYGDLAGTLEGLASAHVETVLVVIEWSDLDARLGVRGLGGWAHDRLDDIVGSAIAQAHRLREALVRLPATSTVVLALPTLPPPPVFPSLAGQASAGQLRLDAALAELAAAVTAHGVRVIDARRLAALSPPVERFDVRSEFNTGFPYRMKHAAALAEALVAVLRTDAPAKGLITDLDDTFWRGLLGEVGVEGVSWNLDAKSQIHALYQQVLAALASTGVLVAIASKNDAALVDTALARKDLLVARDSIYPVEANWGPKSDSVRRILATWNIGPEAVVFVDDSPMELAEVQAAFPDMDCRLFTPNDDDKAWRLLHDLRDLFGKSSVQAEDALRLASIRNADALRQATTQPGGSLDAFLQSAEASIRFELSRDASDQRAFELVNKTNQFNLNGKRLSEADWKAYLANPDAFLLTVGYEDKFGPLGKIAVVLGRRMDKRLAIDAWVLSCRAFSRRVEHRTLAWLFERLGAEEAVFDFAATPRNGPTQEFLEAAAGAPPHPGLSISRDAFLSRAPALYHRIEEDALV